MNDYSYSRLQSSDGKDATGVTLINYEVISSPEPPSPQPNADGNPRFAPVPPPRRTNALSLGTSPKTTTLSLSPARRGAWLPPPPEFADEDEEEDSEEEDDRSFVTAGDLDSDVSDGTDGRRGSGRSQGERDDFLPLLGSGHVARCAELFKGRELMMVGAVGGYCGPMTPPTPGTSPVKPILTSCASAGSVSYNLRRRSDPPGSYDEVRSPPSSVGKSSSVCRKESMGLHIFLFFIILFYAILFFP